MLQKTEAISLSYIKFKESSIIAKFFTDKFGLQSFLVNGVRTAKSKTPLGFFQPFQILEVVQYHKEGKDLQRLVELKPGVALTSLHFHPAKSAQAMFMAELVSKVIQEGQANTSLFKMISDWILELDQSQKGFESFHIRLIWNMLQPLGITPESWQDIFSKNGNAEIEYKHKSEAFFNSVISNSPTPFHLDNETRQVILDRLIGYMQLHLNGIGHLKSITVLREVFN